MSGAGHLSGPGTGPRAGTRLAIDDLRAPAQELRQPRCDDNRQGQRVTTINSKE
ncbi:MAG: hypothetical protein J4F44_04485 [Acidimicrobiia bacterium]|nr:hypothetical protein [Acidimicrobiia bacterium]